MRYTVIVMEPDYATVQYGPGAVLTCFVEGVGPEGAAQQARRDLAFQFHDDPLLAHWDVVALVNEANLDDWVVLAIYEGWLQNLAVNP